MALRMAATAGFPPPEEVVIDGDSTEDEDDDVTVVAPPSRKRKRASLIADEEDEEGEGDEEDEDKGRPINAGARGPASSMSTRRKVQSSLEFVEIRRLEHESKGDGDVEDEDDEVEIVGPPMRATPGSSGSGRKSGRLTILSSDDEQETEVSEQQQQQQQAASRAGRRRSSTTPVAEHGEEARPASASSSSRRSTRIEKKRREKEILNSVTRRLDYPVLENCLDRSTRNGNEEEEAAAGDDDPDYEDEEEEVEQGETFQRPRKRQRPEVEREELHADGGEDLDEFIVGDDEVEYMDDDEKGVISVASSESEGELDAMEEMEAMRAARSRDQSEWFAIYLEYLEESMVDAEMDYKMRRYRNKPHYRTFHEAIRHIERVVCSGRDTLRVNVAWPDELVNAINTASHLRWERVEPVDDCEACNRSGHLATFRVFYSGVACDATELYREGWMERAMKEATPVHQRFDMGSTCHSRTLVYWQLLHAKPMLCAVVDAKRRESGDGRGRIPQGLRNAFYKKEYGRFKRLLGLVDHFSTETRQGISYLPNIWKHVTRKHLESEFLPTPGFARSHDGGSRRGTLDAFVAESEEDAEGEEEDEEEVMEEQEARRRSLSSVPASPNGASDEEKAPAPSATPTGVTTLAEAAEAEPQHFDDLLCLVCHARPRDAAVAHGLYLHYYSCYGCAKRQLRAKRGCVVCDRPIDRVLRVLPITPETRRAIATESDEAAGAGR